MAMPSPAPGADIGPPAAVGRARGGAEVGSRPLFLDYEIVNFRKSTDGRAGRQPVTRHRT